MDDFRVGPVPSSEPFGSRHSYGAIGPRRRRHDSDAQDSQHDENADSFETAAGSDDVSQGPGEPVEDYYLPSDHEPDEE